MLSSVTDKHNMSTSPSTKEHRYEEPDTTYGSRALVLTLLIVTVANFIYFALPQVYALPPHYMTSLVIVGISILISLPGIVKKKGKREALWGIALSVILSPLTFLGILTLGVNFLV